MKPIVQNLFEQAKDLYIVRANSCDNSVTNTSQVVQGSHYEAIVAKQSHYIITSYGLIHELDHNL